MFKKILPAVTGAIGFAFAGPVGASIGANAGELVVAGSVDDLTAGKARIVVEYVYDKD